MRPLTFLLVVAALGSAAPATARPTLCQANEIPVVSCPTRGAGKIMSLCATQNISETEGSLVYRFGRPAKIELTYPDETGPAKTFFRGGIIGAGGGDFVRFTRGNLTYSIEYADGPRSGQYAGVLVYRGTKQIAEFRCHGSPHAAFGPEGFGPTYRANLPRASYSLD